jgi:transcriptional regulator with XRE-family HTH domain
MTQRRKRQNAALMADFGDRLFWLREERERREPGQHNQGQCAHRLGVTQTKYSRWEAGIVWPRLIDLLKLADFFEVSTEYLLRGVMSPPMQDWLREALLREHPELQKPRRFA